MMMELTMSLYCNFLQVKIRFICGSHKLVHFIFTFCFGCICYAYVVMATVMHAYV